MQPIWCIRGVLRYKISDQGVWHRLHGPCEETGFNVASIKFGGGLTLRQASPANGGWCAVKLTALSPSVKYIEKSYTIEFDCRAASECLYGADFPDNSSGAILARSFPLASTVKQFARIQIVLDESDFELGYGSMNPSGRKDFVEAMKILLIEKASGIFKGPTDIFVEETFTF
ncbi:hypothetical protein MMC07_001209 [Pseudocyphellaria aurata]|nr:hypothetical protein [Pseudocyphellaria aurata]